MSFNKTVKAKPEFIKLESISGILLFAVAIFAIFLDNSPLDAYYRFLIDLPFTLSISNFVLTKPLFEWVNEGLMALFFLLVGLEIKREMGHGGELDSLKKISLPGFAALGGMIFPALIYLALNGHDPMLQRGWAIPIATDIAFALGILSLLGPSVPNSLKVFLTALAILDDLGAIIIIALFYTESLSYVALGLAFIIIFLLFLLNFLKVRILTVYLFLGIILWFFILKSGIHATLSGVILAMAMPVQNKNRSKKLPIYQLEKLLHPWVAYFILPLFAFFNAGVSFLHGKNGIFAHTLTWGVILGLLFGKQIGIFTTVFCAVKSGYTKLPRDIDFRWIYGVSLLCGIGFTMSLFIGALAFGEEVSIYSTAVRIGVLTGSFISALLGYIVLYYLGKNKK